MRRPARLPLDAGSTGQDDERRDRAARDGAVRGAASILVIVTSAPPRNSAMQDRHHGRRTTWAFLAMTQNPAAFLHLQHACMDVPLAPRRT